MLTSLGLAMSVAVLVVISSGQPVPAEVESGSGGVSAASQMGDRGPIEDSLSESGEIDAGLADLVKNSLVQLDAPQRTERDAAEQALLVAGPALLPYLPPPEEVASAEVRLRLERVRQSLAVAAVDRATQGSQIALPAGEVSPHDAFRRIRSQTGNRLCWAVPEEPRLTLARPLSGPFWPVMDRLLDAWHGDLKASAEPFALQVVLRRKEAGRESSGAYVSGAFQLQPGEVRRFNEPDGTTTYRTVLAVEWEPVLWPVVVWYDPAWSRAKLATGEIVRPRSGGGRREIPLPRGVYPLRLATDFALPTAEAAIRHWSGRLQILAAIAPHPFAFTLDRDDRPRRQGLGQVSIVLERFERGESADTASLRIEYRDAPIPLKSHLAGIFENRARLGYSDGTWIEGIVNNCLAEADRSAVVQYSFPHTKSLSMQSPPRQLSVTVPLAVRVLEVDYEFSGDAPFPAEHPGAGGGFSPADGSAGAAHSDSGALDGPADARLSPGKAASPPSPTTATGSILRSS